MASSLSSSNNNNNNNIQTPLLPNEMISGGFGSSINPESLQMNPKVFLEIQKIPGNRFCVDCGSKDPDWGSPGLGILFCFQCSGKHRGLGVHISFVRSVRMDVWTDKQIALMKLGGNQRCNDFLKQYGVMVDLTNAAARTNNNNNNNNDNSNNNKQPTVAEKYDTPAAELYKQILVAEYEGKPIPTQLPPPRVNTNNSSTSSSSSKGNGIRRKMEGFGSSPMPSTQQQQQQHLTSILDDPSSFAKTAAYGAAAVVTVGVVAYWAMNQF